MDIILQRILGLCDTRNGKKKKKKKPKSKTFQISNDFKT